MFDRALNGLIWSQTRAAVRHVWRQVKTPGGALMGMVLVVTCGLGVLPNLMMVMLTPDAFQSPVPGVVIPLMPLILFCLANQLVASDAGRRLMELRPPELQFVLAGPFRPSQILSYRLTTLGMNWALMSLFFCGLLIPNFQTALGGYLAIFLGGSFLFSLAFLKALITPRLDGATARAIRVVLRFGLLAVLSEIAWLASESANPLSWATLSQWVQSSYLATVFGYPFLPFAYLTQCPLDGTMVVNGLIGLLSLGCGLACCYRFNEGFSELAVEGVARRQERIARIKGGNLYAIAPKHAARKTVVPQLGWWAGAGPVAWTQAVMIVRRTGRLVPAILLLSLFGTMGVLLASAFGGLSIDPKLRQTGLLVAMGIGTYASFLVLMMAQLGFSMSPSLLVWYQTLPIAPLPLAVGMLFGNFVILLSIRISFSLIGFALTDPSWVNNVVIVLGFVALDFTMASLLNLISASTSLRIQGSGSPDIFQGARALMFMFAVGVAMTPVMILAGVGAFAGGVLFGFSIATCIVSATLVSFALMPLIWWMTGNRFLERELNVN